MYFSKKHFLTILVVSSLSSVAFADDALSSAGNYFIRGDYFSAHMPDGQENLGLVGVHIDKKFTPGFYTGVGVYSAVSGPYSGFFALGGEAGWQHLIYKQLGVDAGVFVGTGGGKNTAEQIGTGSFVMPHLGLFYHFPKFNLGLNYSNIRFNGGHVNSKQWTVNFDWPFQLFEHANLLQSSHSNLNFDWSKNYIAAVGAVYKPHNSQFTSGAPLTRATELLGIEFGHFITKQFYNYFEFTGAVHGNSNGYANLFAGLGWQQPLGESNFSITPRFAVGSGGGGSYNVGTGLLIYPNLGLGWQFMPHWQAEVLSGYLTSPNGHYHAATGELQLRHDFDIAVPGYGNSQNASDFDLQQWRVRAGDQLYIRPQHSNGAPNDNINLFAVKADRFLNPHWYLTGQTAFAFSGHAAGYFSGMLGAGYQTTAYHKLSAFSEATVGTAGGAGLDIHDGALAQLGIGANYQWTPALGVYSEVSKLMALKGSFNPTTLDLGLSYSFGLLNQ